MYNRWRLYTIGGSAAPTILSEGNYFIAPNSSDKEVRTANEIEVIASNSCQVIIIKFLVEQVTKRESSQDWKSWNWKSVNDMFLNGAYFVPSGMGSCAPNYTAAQAFAAAPGSSVPALTSDAGFLKCAPNLPCS